MRLALKTTLALLLAEVGCGFIGLILCSSDLQVKVIPSTEDEHMVSLVCTGCEGPAVYVWYRNKESVYEDRSPWYQELVSSDKAVTYSCAVKGDEDHRAPEVSVDSVASDCFTVTYATGTMCPRRANESCSITYPKKVQVQAEPSKPNRSKLTCNTSCSTMDQQTFIWYKNGQTEENILKVRSFYSYIYSCAVKSHEFLLSDEFCFNKTESRRVRYVSRRICAVNGSSVTISSEYFRPDELRSEHWLKKSRSGLEKLTSPRIKYHNNTEHHNLTIDKLNKNDSAEYIFISDDKRMSWVNKTGVTLVVTDLHVQFAPSAVVTEGQRVTVTCRTSCPLAKDTVYAWFLNNRPQDQTERRSKRLVLDPVSGRDAGKYACAVEKHRSREEVLTVHRKTSPWILVVTGVAAVLLFLIIATVVFMWRKKTTSRQSPGAETYDNVEQISLGHEYADISAPPPPDHVYSTVTFPNSTDAVYSTVKPH